MKLSINHIIKILASAVLIYSAGFAQQKPGNDSVFVMQKSPWGAVLRSAIIPGWGQIYNHSYFKAPVIWGAAAWFIYGWTFYNDEYQRARDLYKQNLNSNFRNWRDNLRGDRDMFAIYLSLLYILNLVDAYVDAQLFDFTVEENPGGNSQYMIGLKIKF